MNSESYKAIFDGEDRSLPKGQSAHGWRKYRIAPELASLGLDMIRILPCQVAMGLFDSTPLPHGKAKQFWVMRLRQLPGLSRLPRGFSRKPLFV